jgi:hypothetical protein
MLRYYEHTWLIHHHAARRSASYKAGLKVLDQIGRFANDTHSLYGMHMDYLMCYFRPENRFPNRIFGGAARNISRPNICSIDAFAYYHFRKETACAKPLPDAWQLQPVLIEDLAELRSWYQSASNGLMIQALDLDFHATEKGSLGDEYKKYGLMRERFLYGLRKNGFLKAILMVNMSDIGLNLSDLTDAVTVIVVDGVGLSLPVVASALNRVCATHKREDVPILIYPLSYADNQKLPYEKEYHLWILNAQYGEYYFAYIDGFLRFYKRQQR